MQAFFIFYFSRIYVWDVLQVIDIPSYANAYSRGSAESWI